MLKDIRLHIEDDEEKQFLLEKELARHINKTQKDNINAFQRFMPSLLNYLSKDKSANISLICNKSGHINIVDYGTGRVFYGFEPEAEVAAQVKGFVQSSLYVAINESESNCSKVQEATQSESFLKTATSRFTPIERASASNDVIIVLGLGLGYHLQILLEQTSARHIIIYEPEIQYFNCSALSTSWRDILDTARRNGVSLYLQLGKDGRDLLADITELEQQTSLSGLFLYKHYNHPIFNGIFKAFLTQPWEQLQEQGFRLNSAEESESYCPVWTPSTALDQLEVVEQEKSLFTENMRAFKKYFPNVYNEFIDYQPKNWLPVEDGAGQVNLLNKEQLLTWYGENPQRECAIHVKNFTKYPNKDGLILGYDGNKLKHYLHNQLIIDNEKLRGALDESEGGLPEEIKSLIVFGLAAGYQLDYLRKNHQIEKLFICEPNRDFFYASLYAINWAEFLREIDEQERRIYINIGDQGNQLFRDLLNQFYAIGPYHLANTYFYRGYYNATLNVAIAQLREQLRVVIAMGEYFDHAYYGINHTREGIRRGYPNLVKNPSAHLSYEDKELPIFIVGNGPSLDMSIKTIKKSCDRAIVISCGTALQALYKNGIQPDFHAEVEQNRATFDWAVRLGDLAFLKEITLVSCNGVHPDTAALYKDVLLAFKSGESSTVSTMSALPEKSFHTLDYAFPTVGNLAVNLFTELGFSQIYLFGIDLGFIDREHHHSKQSGYYSSEGEAIYDYNANQNTSMQVPGNLRKTVFTKYEFRLSRTVMEDALRHFSGDCFNTADGAKIQGTIPLPLENVLVLSTEEQKRSGLEKLKTECFGTQGFTDFDNKTAELFDATVLSKQLKMLRDLAETPFEREEDAERFVEVQKSALFSSYKGGNSLLYYYLYGTINYVNAMLSKLLGYCAKDRISLLNESREIWAESLSKISNLLVDVQSYFDISSSFINQRALNFFELYRKGHVLVLCQNSESLGIFKEAPLRLGLTSRFDYYNAETFLKGMEGNVECYDEAMIFLDEFDENLVLSEKLNSMPKAIYVVKKLSLVKRLTFIGCQVVYFPGDFEKAFNPISCHDFMAFYLSYSYLGISEKASVIYPKHSILDEGELQSCINLHDLPKGNAYDCGRVVAFSVDNLETNELLMPNGSRATKLHRPLSYSDFIQAKLSKNEKVRLKESLLSMYKLLRAS